jgi:hypothetical protein
MQYLLAIKIDVYHASYYYRQVLLTRVEGSARKTVVIKINFS